MSLPVFFFGPREFEVVAKPEWGLKRTCQSCGAHFYDMRRNPAVCPKCGTEFDPEAVLKSKRAKAADRIAPTEIPEADDQLDVITDDLIDADETEEEEVIEDTSELGEDDEDVADVIENVDEDDDR